MKPCKKILSLALTVTALLSLTVVGAGAAFTLNGGKTPLTLPKDTYGTATPAVHATKESGIEESTFGIGKGTAMAAVIDTVFGYDLREYAYVSYVELWTDEAIPEEHAWLQCILRDIFIEIEEGQFMPMGFLYKDDTAYTVVEQPDGTLSLTQYSLLPETNAVTAQGNESSSDIPEYQVVDTQVKRADRALIDSMYQ